MRRYSIQRHTCIVIVSRALLFTQVTKLKEDKEALDREMDELKRKMISSQETCTALTQKLEHKRKKQLERSQRSQDRLVSAKYVWYYYDNNNFFPNKFIKRPTSFREAKSGVKNGHNKQRTTQHQIKADS